jgi:hypothetical protein
VSLSNYVVTCLAVGDLDAAGAASAACIAIRGRVITRLHGTLRYNEGLVAEAGGDLTGARRAYRSSLDHRTAHQQEALCIDSAAGLLRIATAEHKPQSMRVLLLDLERRIGERGLDGVEYPVSCFLARANAHLALGERDRAWLLAGEGLEFVQVRSRTIADPTARTRYLERVPVHQQLRNLLASLHEAPG